VLREGGCSSSFDRCEPTGARPLTTAAIISRRRLAVPLPPSPLPPPFSIRHKPPNPNPPNHPPPHKQPHPIQPPTRPPSPHPAQATTPQPTQPHLVPPRLVPVLGRRVRQQLPPGFHHLPGGGGAEGDVPHDGDDAIREGALGGWGEGWGWWG